jgi:histidinol-phosphate aminotransferase
MPDLRETIGSYQPKIIFLATPNNPDGSLLDHKVLDELLTLPIITVLDEAYIEFSNGGSLGESTSHIRQVLARDNLIVLRTFSKWAGLAGLRIGYGAFPDWLIPTLWKAKQPYNVNVAASEAAVASLQDLDHHRQIVTKIKGERKRLFNLLSAIDWLLPYPSQANFILCKVLQGEASMLRDKLASEYGILIRYFDKPGLQDHIRISVGRPEDSDSLIQVLNLIH